jgi:hypothetical protein
MDESKCLVFSYNLQNLRLCILFKFEKSNINQNILNLKQKNPCQSIQDGKKFHDFDIDFSTLLILFTNFTKYLTRTKILQAAQNIFVQYVTAISDQMIQAFEEKKCFLPVDLTNSLVGTIQMRFAIGKVNNI